MFVEQILSEWINQNSTLTKWDNPRRKQNFNGRRYCTLDYASMKRFSQMCLLMKDNVEKTISSMTAYLISSLSIFIDVNILSKRFSKHFRVLFFSSSSLLASCFIVDIVSNQCKKKETECLYHWQILPDRSKEKFSFSLHY